VLVLTRLRAAAAIAAASPPSSRASAALSTAKPVPMPTWRLSTASTGTEALRAASWADSNVPLSSPDRWIDTISLAPSAASRS
jgi:hypothetical protein